MKYVIQHRVGNGKNAGSKAIRDVTCILTGLGYNSLNIYKRFYHHWWSLFKMWYTLKKGDVVFLQWPFYYMSTSVMTFILKMKKVDLTILLHDINSLRNVKSHIKEEDTLLDYANKIIVHTNAMKNYLVSKKVEESKIFVLTSFDYITEEETPKRELSNIIVYAGNLLKSKFLRIIPVDSYGLKFNCYGLPANVIPDHLSYNGAFSPENTSILKGSWGLVWDGNSTDTCSGINGEYLRINSPHKLSLYIVSGLPLIVWEHSALADYVIKNNLGITVKSIMEISDKLNKIRKKEYKEIQDAVRKEAIELKNGNHLKQAIGVM